MCIRDRSTGACAADRMACADYVLGAAGFEPRHAQEEEECPLERKITQLEEDLTQLTNNTLESAPEPEPEPVTAEPAAQPEPEPEPEPVVAPAPEPAAEPVAKEASTAVESASEERVSDAFVVEGGKPPANKDVEPKGICGGCTVC
eukprot:TRINITY_DN5474_c0_g1_i1.p2 TRINITY_DN5474_c0_g1~~TRINITY_DN5474_c0_g1_i1.p2  ORF type:complete len:146 (-),score=51.07 TRINITY_DN5474_c0_g1_i1:200-637(-)